MAAPKTPFWKRFTVTKTKNPISSTKPPARLGVVVAPTVEGLEKKEWIDKQKRMQTKKFGSVFRTSPGDMDKFFKTAWEKEQGTYKRLKPKRKPINYYKSARKTTFDTMEQVSKFMKAKPKLTLAAKAIKITKSLTPWGLAGTTLLYAASKAYDPERVKKSKTQSGIK